MGIKRTLSCLHAAEEALDKITEQAVQALQAAMEDDARFASGYTLEHPVRFYFEGARVMVSEVEIRDGTIHVVDSASEFELEFARVPFDAARGILSALPEKVRALE